MPISVQDKALESTASHIETTVLNLSTLVSELSDSYLAGIVPAINQLTAAVIQQTAIVQKIADAVTEQPPTAGMFNPPPDLVTTINVEIQMSVLQLEVGQTAAGKMTFDEPAPPADGAVASDDATVATITLDPDMVSWTVVGMSVGTANMSYTGTSAPPDAGPAVVPNMVVTVVAVPVAEHGDFDPMNAVITGP